MTAPDLAQIPMSAELSATLARGAEFAGATGAGEISLEHLLAALCDDPDALAILDASHIGSERLKSDVITRVLEASPPGAPPQQSLGVSAEVRRILEAAAAASRGSRRRDINGAIVLAAIVGDARSLAAQILESHGLTFENAIRALQSTLGPPRQAPAQPPVADDVLARARERVQSRSAPSLRDIMKDMPRPAPIGPVPMPESPVAYPTHTEAPPDEPPFSPPQEPEPGPPEEEVAEEPIPEPAPAPIAREPAPEPEPPRAEPPRVEPRPAPAAVEAEAHPRPPFPAPPRREQPRSQPGAEVPPSRRPDPPFGTPAQNAGQGANPSPFPQEPSLSPPARPGQYAPPREAFDLPPRPQPSRAQPPPIPAPGLGGPPGPHGPQRPPMGQPVAAGQPPAGRGPGPGPNPNFGNAPSLDPRGPASAPPGRPGPGPDTGFHPGPPLGAPGPMARPDQPVQNSMARARRAPKRGKGAGVETGQLAENIPRSMRVGKTVRAEVRIAKASVKALTEGMDGGGQVWQHAVAITKAMSVRLRAPDGDFYIESASPETQWIESNLGYGSDDFASWRFLITPKSRGWSDLQIIVSARTIGADGVAAETALPDQIVEVKVRANLGRTLARLFGWTVAAIAGGALATFGEKGIAIVSLLLKKSGH